MSGAAISQPDVTFSNVPAQQKISTGEQRALIVGLMASAGTATAGALVANIGNDNSEKNLFGHSHLAGMIANFKKINRNTRVDAIGVAEPSGGSASTGTITIAGTATANGEVTFYIGNKDVPINVTFLKDDDATAMATKVKDAITAKASDLSVTASAAAGVVTLTANQKGEQGDFIGLAFEGGAAGATVTISAMTGGAGTPDLTGVFDVIDGVRYQTIVWPWASDTDEVTDLLEARWNVKNNVLDGVAITCNQGTHASQLSELANFNFKSLVFLCNGALNLANHKGGMILESPENIAAQFGGMRALRYTDGTVLTPYLTTTAGLDQYGGPGIAALPYFNTLMPYLPTLPSGTGYSSEEVEQLLAAGGSCLGNNIAGTNVICGEIVTTYKTDPAGNKDDSYKFLNYVDESSIAREYFWRNIRKRFAQSRLTNGAIINGRDMANAQTVRTYSLGLWGDLTGPDYTILQAGEEQKKYFKDNLFVTLDLAKGRITILAKLCYVTQAREFLGTLEMVFDINGG